MNQCLRCSKSCIATAVFCDECRSQLRSQLQHKTSANVSGDTSSTVALLSELVQIPKAPLERITNPHPIVKTPPTPPPSLANYINMVDQAIVRLNEAAERIAETEQSTGDSPPPSGRRIPHASRLTPIRDISADIRRESTPLPQITKVPESELGEDLGGRMPDLWPWLQDTDAEENENYNWANYTDPLLSRHIPNSVEAAKIEQEDIKRAIAEGITTAPFPTPGSRSSRIRIIFTALAIMGVLAILVDGFLLSLAFNHSRHPLSIADGPPTLSLSSNIAHLGQAVVLHIKDFTPSTKVLLTRDIEEAIVTNTGSSLINVGPTGAKDASITIDDSWGAGFHTIIAEDVKTRSTAQAQLRVVGEGPTQPSHLVIGITSLNLGADLVGANTIHSVVLRNSGGGSISWQASSNAPWLLVSPTQGMFSESETITIAAQRANLKPRDYQGMITIYSNVGSPQHLQIEMTVNPLPLNAGPVLVVTPPVLSFIATDGGGMPAPEILIINNPGSRNLSWSLTGSTPPGSATPAVAESQQSLFTALGPSANWLSTDRVSGNVPPGGTLSIHVYANSKSLLPGLYMGTFQFFASGALNSPQSISVSLTVQPRCGLAISIGSLAFTAVAGKGNPSNQVLGLSATASCPGSVSWQALSSVRWLMVAPGSGQLRGVTSTVTSVSVNTSGLPPGNYSGAITFSTGTTTQSTQTVMVQLSVQAPPPPSAPIMSVSPLTLNFSNTQGQPNPASQVVLITNNGGGTLAWSTSVNPLATSWLGAYPTGGKITANQSGQLTVNVSTAGLSPGTYVGQVILTGTDLNRNAAGGSPQTITINLVVQPPCAFAQPSASSLSFSATQGGSNPNSQTVTVTGSGSCAWPLKWSAAFDSTHAPWLNLSSSSGTLNGVGQGISIGISANIAGLTPGSYNTHISLSAIDSAGMQAQGSPETISVTLVILPPCSLRVGPSSLSFSVPQGQQGTAQNLNINESGNCTRPVSWNVSADASSSSWLLLSPTSGSDTGGGSPVSVNVNPPATLPPGTYTGLITISASGSGGVTIPNSPQTISVTLTVTGFTVSGTIMACSDITCVTTTALPGAAVSLMSGTTVVATVTADGSGNYTFTNIALGAYTLSASGSDSNGIHYTGTLPVTVTGDLASLILKIPPG